MPDQDPVTQLKNSQPPRQAQGEPAPQPEEKEEYKPKLTFTEIFFIGGLYALSDVFTIILVPLGLNSLISLPRAGASQIYFYFKKMGTEITIINWVTGLVTGTPEVPIPSVIGWGIIVLVDRVGMAKLEEITKKAGKIGEFVEKNAKRLSKITSKIK